MRSHKKIQWSAFLAGISVMATVGLAFAQDRFSDWSDMEASGCFLEGPQGDYEIVAEPGQNVCTGETCYKPYEDILVLAIHGGRVEPGTDELAYDVAVSNTFCDGSLCDRSGLYQMIADVKPGTCTLPDGSEFTKAQKDLHITATHFDEPQALNLVNNASTIVSIHGLADDSYAGTDKNVICVGGQNEDMRDYLVRVINGNPSLFDFVRAEDATDPGSLCPSDATGTDPDNIANLGQNPDGGLQLEITRTVRDALDDPLNAFEYNRLVVHIKNTVYYETVGAL